MLRWIITIKLRFRVAFAKSMDIKPGDKLELTIVGMHNASKLLVAKERRRYGR